MHKKSILISFSLAVVSFILGVIFSIPPLLLIESDKYILLSQGITLQMMGIGGTAIAYLAYTNNLNFDFINLKRPSFKDSQWIVATPLFLFLSGGIINFSFQQLGVTSSSHGMVETVQGNPNVIIFAITLGILAGIFEELLYRGVIQTTLQNNHSSEWLIILLPNIIFALIHIPAYATGGINSLIVSLVVIFVGGSIFGTVYYRTQNLIVPIIAHSLYNTVALIAVFVFL